MSLSNTNKIYLVKESIFKLANFTSEEWDFYQSIIDEVSFKKKEFLTKRGDVEKYAYFILEGAVKYEASTEQGKEICVDLGFQGNLVSSFSSCLSQRPSNISIQAVTNIKAFRLRYPPVLELLETSKNAERFHRLIAEQLYIRETRRTYTLISKSAMPLDLARLSDDRGFTNLCGFALRRNRSHPNHQIQGEFIL